ncbi:hypothetical protein RvY_13658 [Ramazzottius varieornatus]|uniref:Peptidase M12B domain-containing protein n=1 Tax=Ramazzottius varieornatus TaxID=947166 RepID=A0A1D1VX67_RAMVA|nr:hypothetical protein RvY_13658 [Ramazzottius varieornatus]
MNRDFGTRTQHVNFVLQAFAAVNAMFNDPVFGPLIPTIRVMEIVFDMNHTRFISGLEEPGQGEAQNYLGNFCEYVAENRYANGLWRTDWDAWIALTALDLWAPVLQVSQDGLYKDRFRAEKVTEVLGLSYTGGACKPKRNCVIVEFNGFDVVDTIAHEIGHTLGMDHDPETDYTLPFEQKRNKIMALHAGKSRKGWSEWSVESYIEFMEKGKSPYCSRCPNDPCPDCGGYCLRKNRPSPANSREALKAKFPLTIFVFLISLCFSNPFLPVEKPYIRQPMVTFSV